MVEVTARRKRTQEQRSSEMRVRLLDATIACLVEYGYSATTTSRVAEMAGVTRGAQVHHFRSRDDLVVAAVRHLAARRAAEAVSELVSLQRSGDRLGALLDLLWRIHDGPLFVATIELMVAGRTDETLREEVRELEKVVRAHLTTAVGNNVPGELGKPMVEFVYTAMDVLRGILISGFMNDDAERSKRRWDRATVILRRSVHPDLQRWVLAGTQD